MLRAISPIDGRYASKTNELQDYFSEYALIKYRVEVEVRYFQSLCKLPLPQLENIDLEVVEKLGKIYTEFSETDAQEIKTIERTTNHDVKAVEYFIKGKLKEVGLDAHLEFIHFALTSQDVNNTATPMLIRDAVKDVLSPMLQQVIDQLKHKAELYKGIPMLARTHGQPASPTSLGKEVEVFIERLEEQFKGIDNLKLKAKFGGATGNFNAHKVAYPDIDWMVFADAFVEKELNLERSQKTTQIAHYDSLAALFHNLMRINTILIDLCRDIWTYISMDYFGQKVIAGEVGSSAMPHKVNPIDFENAEGNLGMATAILQHLGNKLPISRLQRDLTDSTVLRNVGVPCGHILIALKSILKGLDKIVLKREVLEADLDSNWAVVAEAVQNILRRESYPEPYEALKKLTRGNSTITEKSIHAFIHELDVVEEIKKELLAITPYNYIGYI